jgi:transcriptional regulator with XRE-family HTH domain
VTSRLKTQRLDLGLSQLGLAKLLGVSRWSVARWESNQRPVPKVVAGLMYALTTLSVDHDARRVVLHFLLESK